MKAVTQNFFCTAISDIRDDLILHTSSGSHRSLHHKTFVADHVSEFEKSVRPSDHTHESFLFYALCIIVHIFSRWKDFILIRRHSGYIGLQVISDIRDRLVFRFQLLIGVSQAYGF